RSLTRALQNGEATTARTSLARTARFLVDAGEPQMAGDEELRVPDLEPWLETVDSAWGPLRRVRCPGVIEGIVPEWSRAPGPLGTDPPAF
ncbi:MAG: hypothetical protein ACJ781_00610, partial [Myxococcales bacterium]